MHNKKFLYSMIFMFCLISISMVSSAPPQETTSGYIIRTAFADHLQLNKGFDVHAHVFLESDGTPVTDANCTLHLYTKDGHHLYEGSDAVVSHNFDYAWDLSAGNFSEIGTHTYIIQCDGSVGVDDFGGFISGEVYINGFGEELTTGSSINFNMGMLFLFMLFSMAMIGLFGIENIVGKFACYWIAHLLFIVGTFSVWQYSAGYGVYYLGLAGIFKVLFYVSIIAMFPMMIMSIAGLITYWATDKKVQRLIDKGMPEAEAYRRQGRKYK